MPLSVALKVAIHASNSVRRTSSLQSRRVGDITVVKCRGRIVEGAESAVLHQHLADWLPHEPWIVLDLGEVHFIDSSGLGLLVRFLSRTRTAQGDLKLCAVPAAVAEVLRITKLRTILESHESEADAISALYQRRTSVDALDYFNPEVLCVEKSEDVLAYVGELLRQAGYGVITSGNLPDALILLKATQPKVVVISAELRSASTWTGEAFNGLADARAVVELPADFSSHDAGHSGGRLLDQIRVVLTA